MKTQFIFALLLVIIFSTVVNAQSNSGITVGVNSTFNKDTELFDYSSKIGYNFGYQHNFTLYKKWHLLIGASYNKYNLSVDYFSPLKSTYPYYVTEKKSTDYLSIPIAINYPIKKFYVLAGYQYGRHIANGNMMVNKNNHSLLTGVGINFGFMDLLVKYTSTLNQETTDIGYVSYIRDDNSYDTYPKKTHKLNNIQFSLVIPLSKK